MLKNILQTLYGFLKDHLRNSNPNRVAIITFVSLGIISVVILSVVVELTVQYLFITLAAVMATAERLYTLTKDLSESSVTQENQDFKAYASEIGDIKGDLTDYDRVIRILEARGLSLDSLLEHSNGSRAIWISFGDQELDSSQVDFDTEADEEVDDEIDEEKWLKYGLKRDHDLVNITPQSWLIPPAVVEKEGLETADNEQLTEWLKENLFDEFPGSTVTIPLMTVIDLGRSYVKEGGAGSRLKTAPIKIMKKSETFTEEDLLEALEDEEINLLDVVKSGDLIFFLPLSLNDDKVAAIEDQGEIATEQLSDESLRGLANPDNITELSDGLNRIEEVEDPDGLAEDIHKEAKRWERILSGS